MIKISSFFLVCHLLGKRVFNVIVGVATEIYVSRYSPLVALQVSVAKVIKRKRVQIVCAALVVVRIFAECRGYGIKIYCEVFSFKYIIKMEKRKDSLSVLKLCRFCLCRDSSLTSLYEGSRTSKNVVPLSLKIHSCLSFEVSSA